MNVFPSRSPPTAVACDLPPVVEKVSLVRLYATPAAVEYRHVAASSVFKERVAEVVPAGRVPVGEPSLRPGGVVSLPLLPASEASGETARMAASSTKPATATATIRSPRHFTVFMGAASLARYRLSVSTLFRISPETRLLLGTCESAWVPPRPQSPRMRSLAGQALSRGSSSWPRRRGCPRDRPASTRPASFRSTRLAIYPKPLTDSPVRSA